jgi:molybdopterin molybdotransferase
MLPLAEALAAYARLVPVSSETLPLHAALGRVLAEDAIAAHDLPPFSQSAMDGYALHHEDSGQTLPIAGTIAPGAWPQPFPTLKRGTAWRILTGAALPTGATAVVAQERADRFENTVRLPAVEAGRNVRFQGEELRTGATLAQVGQVLRAPLLASLIQGGVRVVEVRRRLNIAALITGDELADHHDHAGRIADSNGPLVQGWLQERGHACTVQRLTDDKAQQQRTLAEALQHNDLVITTGGASVGDKDHLVGLAEVLGVEKVFWQVAQKPGKPLFFGLHPKGTALIGLPGNPGAVLVGLLLHVATALAHLEGRPALHWRHAPLLAAVQPDRDRARLLRMRLSHDNRLEPLGFQDSHMLHNLQAAEVLAVLPAGDAVCEAGAVLGFVGMV